jgi:hypothetical protein
MNLGGEPVAKYRKEDWDTATVSYQTSFKSAIEHNVPTRT